MSEANSGVSQRLLANLGSAIVQGDYEETGRLPTELALCKLHKVSRSAVREAIRILSSKGMVQSRRRQGTAVNHPDQWNLLDPDVLNWIRELEYSHRLLQQLVQMRIAVEPEAAAIVAGRRAYVDFSTMAKTLTVMDREDASKEELIEADVQFHMEILHGTGNRFFRQMKSLVTTSLNFGFDLMELYEPLAPNRGDNANEHRALMNFMLDGDAEGARRHSRQMIDKVKVVVDQLCQKEYEQKRSASVS